MKSGICPKCGSSEVYAGTHLPPFAKMGSNWANTIPITPWVYAGLDNYVCVDCGYVESYVAARYKRAMIAQKWPRVGESTAPVGIGENTCPACGSCIQKGWKACPYCGQPLV
jgi:hypothetical protein